MKNVKSISNVVSALFYLIAIGVTYNFYKSPLAIFRDTREILRLSSDIGFGEIVVAKITWFVSIPLLLAILYSVKKLNTSIVSWSASQNEFDYSFVKNFRIIGYALSITGFLGVLLIGFRGLDQYAWAREYMFLGINTIGTLFITTCGLLFLLFSEMIKVSHGLKEENDLTI